MWDIKLAVRLNEIQIFQNLKKIFIEGKVLLFFSLQHTVKEAHVLEVATPRLFSS